MVRILKQTKNILTPMETLALLPRVEGNSGPIRADRMNRLYGLVATTADSFDVFLSPGSP